MDFNDRIKLNIFNAPTTYLDDYRRYNKMYRETPDYSKSQYEPPKYATKPITPMDQETFLPLRKKLSFSFTIFPNEITRGTPHREFGNTVLPEDDKKEEAKKTRPRVYCSPQVSMDDVPDEEMRKLLVDYTYTTDFKNAQNEPLSLMNLKDFRKIPNTVIEHDRFLHKTRKHYFSVIYKPKQILLPQMSEELNRKGEKWTNQQVLGTTSPTERFWKEKEVKCGACINPTLNLVDKETKQKIETLMEKDWMRLPHDTHVIGYSGYKPNLALGINLQKKVFPCAHPLQSTPQVVARRKLKESDIPKFD